MNGSPSGSHLAAEAETVPREPGPLSEKLVLSLRSSSEVLESEDTVARTWFNWGAFKILSDTNQRRIWAATMMRLIRSLLLITKVMTLRGLCPDPSTGPRPIVATLLLALAIGDTVIDHDWSVQVRRRGSRHGKSRPEDDELLRNRSPMIRFLSRFDAGVWITVGLTVLHFALITLSGMSDRDGFLTEIAVIWRRACCVPLDQTEV